MDLVFHRPDGRPIVPDEDERAFRDLMRASGISDPDARFGHESRYAVVTLLATIGTDYSLIREIVGHSSDAMVDHYRSISSKNTLAAMETLDSSLDLKAIEWQS